LEALKLRLRGKTYGEIRSFFNIPKSTLSVWFSRLPLGKEAQRILRSKRRRGYLKLVEFNKARTVRIREENKSIKSEFKSKIGKLSNRELMILGAALYWGEGYKNFTLNKKRAYPYICFGNSDPNMIMAFVSFVEKILSISRDKIRAQIIIYPNLKAETAVNYWQAITRIPRENFRCQIALSRASKLKRPKHLLPYGTLQLRINRRQEFFKIMGLIEGIVKAF